MYLMRTRNRGLNKLRHLNAPGNLSKGSSLPYRTFSCELYLHLFNSEGSLTGQGHLSLFPNLATRGSKLVQLYRITGLFPLCRDHCPSLSDGLFLETIVSYSLPIFVLLLNGKQSKLCSCFSSCYSKLIFTFLV